MENQSPKLKLKKNQQFQLEKIVTVNETAKVVGSGGLEVLATPILISWVEALCFQTIEKEISNDFTTVGSYIEINHLKASPVGQKVTIRATIESIYKNRINFSYTASGDSVLVAAGTHERAIVNKQKFLKQIYDE